MIDFDDGAGCAEGRLLGNLFHRENRTARYVYLIEDVHDLHLRLGHGPFLDFGEDVHESGKPCIGRVEV
jgi:hypothetical protein